MDVDYNQLIKIKMNKSEKKNKTVTRIPIKQ